MPLHCVSTLDSACRKSLIHHGRRRATLVGGTAHVEHYLANSLCLVCVDASDLFSSPFFFFQAEDGIRDLYVTGVQTCALPILPATAGDRQGLPARDFAPQRR